MEETWEGIAGKSVALPCDCKVEGRELPLHGGDRHYTCDHGHRYVIRGKIQKIIRFKIERKG